MMNVIKSLFVFIIFIVTNAASYGAVNIVDGLLVNLDFDNNIQNQAAGSSIVATSKGLTAQENYASGQFGSAAYFNNTSSGTANTSDWYVSLGNLNSYYQQSWSISLWVNIQDTADRAFFGNKTWYSGASAGWCLAQNSGGKFNTNRGSNGNSSDVSLGLKIGQWSNVIATVDKATDTIKVYVDGSFVASRSLVNNNVYGANDTVIGAGSNGGLGAKAYIDEVGIWNRVLNDDEIAALQNNTIKALIPEPSACALLLLAGLGFGLNRRKD